MFRAGRGVEGEGDGVDTPRIVADYGFDFMLLLGLWFMTKAIFTTRVTPSYDDRPEEYYHFPSAYLNQVRAAVGDQIIYYEPRRVDSAPSSRGGRQAYFASAR